MFHIKAIFAWHNFGQVYEYGFLENDSMIYMCMVNDTRIFTLLGNNRNGKYFSE